MQLAIYTNGGDYFLHDDLLRLLSLAESQNISLIFNEEYVKYVESEHLIELDSYRDHSDIECDFLVSFGGDGTFLQAVALLRMLPIPILGVNSGRMGFLSTVDKSSFESALNLLISGEYEIEERSMLSVESESLEKYNIFPHLFNEFTIQKSELSMVEIVLEINGNRALNIAADGIIVSTPSGSTAYSLSSGGAILSPDCRAFIITPIAPHNITLRPIIVDERSKITLSVKSRSPQYYATLDNRAYRVATPSSFALELSSHKVSLVKVKGDSFFDTLRKKLYWGSENRY